MPNNPTIINSSPKKLNTSNNNNGIDIVKNLTSKISNLLASEPKIVDDKTNSICSFTNCVEKLNITKIRFHCRVCNGWYCSKHSGHPSFTILLDPLTGQPTMSNDPKGCSSRVCEHCFFNQVSPFQPEPYRNDLTEKFKELRSAARLKDMEKREEILKSFEKLKNLLTRDKKNPLRLLERSIVRWKENSEMSSCKCGLKFQNGSLKNLFSLLSLNLGLDSPNSKVLRHHCRACGTIICDDCSTFKEVDGIYSKLRICNDCHILLRPLEYHPPGPKVVFGAKFSELKSVERQILDIIPKFEEQMFLLEEGIEEGKDVCNLFLETKCSRETLILCFRHFEGLAREIRDNTEYPESHELTKIKRGIYQYSIQFLKDNMFPLKLMPKLKKHSQPSSIRKKVDVFTSSMDTIQTKNSVKSVFGKMAESLFNVISSNEKNILKDELIENQIPAPHLQDHRLPSNINALRSKAIALRDQRGQLIIQISNPELNDDPNSLEILERVLQETEEELSKTRGIIRDCLRNID